MQINKMDNSPKFGERIKLNNLEKSLSKIAKDLGTEPEMLVGAASISGLSSSAASLATGNYSGLAKVLPINVSIPLGTAIASTVGYKSLVGNAKNAMEQQAKNAKRRGGEVPEQIDPNFLKAVFKNLKERFMNIWKLGNK